ncbi:MAG: hypothetical protein ACRDO1_18530 [Nocardioidaceae bacterium]
MPEPQVDIHDANGHLIGRVDFLWRALRLIGEADGKTKYVDNLDPTTPRDERLWLERLRHDQLHDEDFDIVRWTHPDLYQRPTTTRNRIFRAMERARR